jgi:hypothetical protein
LSACAHHRCAQVRRQESGKSGIARGVGDVIHRRRRATLGGHEQLEVARAGGALERDVHRHSAGLQVSEQAWSKVCIP